MSKERIEPWNTPLALFKRGVCATCRTAVGKENLVNVRDRWICVACGEAAIAEWNRLCVGS